ncbi:MAG TPA: IS200/IS605 family transposase [Pyrinomonadaceae bacterium]|nr:IS200/IS605 family transposase [Pyrinomonadaceae bacterium]
MSHTHLLYHIVLGTKDHFPLISPTWEDELYRYLGGIIRNHKGKPIAINGMPDHTHVFARLEPVVALSDFVRDLKASSSKWIRNNHQPKFSWQRRYGAFSVSESAANIVRDYVRNQKKHHLKRNFENEYKGLLRQHNVDFDDKYLWD